MSRKRLQKYHRLVLKHAQTLDPDAFLDTQGRKGGHPRLVVKKPGGEVKAFPMASSPGLGPDQALKSVRVQLNRWWRS